MPVTKAFCVSLIGLNGTIIEIEAEISSNLPAFVLVGLPDASLMEAKDRVRAAAMNSGMPLPGRRVTVNLSPASVPKKGASYDLAIAMSILAASGKTAIGALDGWIHLGELGLDGAVRGVPGVLPALLAAKRAGWTRFIVPAVNMAEAALVSGVQVLGAKALVEVAKFHGAEVVAEDLVSEIPHLLEESNGHLPDLADVIGQEEAIEALTLAAAGGHHMLMVGPPGVGKTMLAERLPSILPSLTFEESLETTALRSIAGYETSTNLSMKPPFEAPHHTASMTSLIGGGSSLPKPGLISLANHGVLFLDEAPEFQRPFLEALRQPIESGEVLITRSAGMARFPARFQLVLAANPCPCGNFSAKARSCVCGTTTRLSYMSKLTGPLLDRIDVRLFLQPPSAAQSALAKIGAKEVGRSSSAIRSKVEAARDRARHRLSGTPWTVNAHVPGSYLRGMNHITAGARKLLDKGLDRGTLSMRGYDRCLRMACTSADLAGREIITDDDVSFASMLRGGDGAAKW